MFAVGLRRLFVLPAAIARIISLMITSGQTEAEMKRQVGAIVKNPSLIPHLSL